MPLDDLFDLVDTNDGYSVVWWYMTLFVIGLAAIVLGVMTLDESVVAGTLRIGSGLVICGTDIVLFCIRRDDSVDRRQAAMQLLIAFTVIGLAGLVFLATNQTA